MSETHGGSLDAARRLFPGVPEPWLDLSTGINPHPYPVPALDPACWARLPEPGAVIDLQAAAARAYGVPDPAMIVASPGTEALIALLARMLPAHRVAVLGPTYSYARAWAAATVVGDFDELAGADVAVLCNPNNPDGRHLAPDAVRTLAARCGTLVVDEAFADFHPGISIAADPPARAIVLRSFGKAYGLAGLRLGFAIAAPDRAAAMRAALGDWPLSGPALAIGARALADRTWLAEAHARLRDDAAALDGVLEGAGLTVLGGTTLFRLASSDNAPAVFAALGRAGVYVRRFADHPPWLRFGLPPDAAARERLRSALRRV